jgi:hypothetical protein
MRTAFVFLSGVFVSMFLSDYLPALARAVMYMVQRAPVG